MDNREPNLVSVIIPCYNHAHFLGEAIESVLKQTYPYFEVIVIDDGSTDNSSEIATRYSNVRCIRQENQGLSGARNRGIRESKGSYLIFLDADDRLLPNALEIGVNAFNSHPGYAFVYGRSQQIDLKGNFIPAIYDPVPTDHYLALLRRNHIWMPAQVMYRRNTFDQVEGFHPALSAAADYDLYLRISRCFPVYNHNQIIAEYRQHPDNMSRNYGLMLKTTITVLRSQRRFLRGNKRYKQAYKEGINFWQSFYGEEFVDEFRFKLRKPSNRLQAMKDVITLVHYFPKSIYIHLFKKVKITVLGILGIRPVTSMKEQIKE